jgi:hypothetical protein
MSNFFPANVPLVNYFFYNSTLTASGPNLPLAGGFVFFRDNNDHDIDKNTYSDVSDPNAPVVNPNPLPLNAVGAWPLFYAEAGVYYIVITGPDADFDNPIWTLENVNFAGEPGSSSTNVINYISNGQFLLHNDLPAEGVYAAGEIREPITPIAYGGWTFDRTIGSTSTDLVTFERYDEWISNPTGNPRFNCRVKCTDFDTSDTVKDVRIKFPDVNSFSSNIQQYTFAFSAINNVMGNFPVDLYLIKNFGTGGSDQTQTLLTNFTITGAQTDFYYAFIFGDNEDQAIGAANDDYVQLALRMSRNTTFDISLTDGQLQSGNLIEPAYPESTQQQDVSSALGGGFPIPNPDGSDLYLLPRLTKTGWVYDDTEIGDVDFKSQFIEYDLITGLHATSNLMLPAGYKYITADYSPLGIPFRRLFNEYFDDTTGVNVPAYGTGSDYLTCGFSGSGNQLIFSNNSAGTVTAAAQGSLSTTFTIGIVHQGDTGYFCRSYLTSANTFYIENTNAGAVTAIDAGTSGFTVATIQIGTSILPNISSVQTVAASAMTGGDYFGFYTYSGAPQQRYLWVTIDGVGADPAPGGTGTLVALLGTDTDALVAQKIRTGLNGWEVTSVLTAAASVIPPGAFFTINSTGAAYVPWYRKDGAGVEPVAAGTKIPIDIAGADTDTQVATKTQIAMNSYSFANPDPRGCFLRVANSGATVDPGVRWSMVPGIIGTDKIGTFELSANIQHDHLSPTGNNFILDLPGFGVVGGSGASDSGLNAVQPSGISESRGINMNFNLGIRY